MARTLEITLPLPHKLLSPNGRTRNHRYKFSVIASARCAAALATIDAANRSQTKWSKLERATMQGTFYHKAKRNRDDDNANASLKAYRDGIADSGIVADDNHITMLPPVQLIDKENPRLVVTITEIDQ